MNATSLYVSTSRLILQAKGDDSSTWVDLYRLFPCLRQSLSCTVCGNLLMEPYTPTDSTCQHHVCRSCKGGKKKLKPSCSWCKDYSKYIENVQLRTLLQCYKKLCQYVTCSDIYRSLVTVPSSSTNNNLTVDNCNHLLELIKEGTGFKDEYKHNSKPYILPLKFQQNFKTASTQTNLIDNVKENDRLKSIISNGKSPTYSVICTDNGNRLTFKRTAKGNNNLDKRNGKPPSKDKRNKKTCSFQEDNITTNRQKTNRTAGLDKERLERLKKRSSKSLEDTKNRTDQKIRSRSTEQRDKNKCPTPQEEHENRLKRKRTAHEENISNTKVNKVRKRSVFTKPPTCRCGVITQCKGTCRGYRCPCYSADKSCLDCGCVGCKNPRGASLNKINPSEGTLDSSKLKEDNQILMKEKI